MPAKFHPVEFQTEDVAEAIVISWIERETPAPAHLASIVARYGKLTIYRDQVPDPTPVDQAMDKLYDHLVQAATVKLTISRKAEAQLRRIQHREEARMTWTQRVNSAIDQWREGVRA